MDRFGLKALMRIAVISIASISVFTVQAASDVDFTGVGDSASLGQPYVYGDFTFDQDVSGGGAEFVGISGGNAIGNDDAGLNSNTVSFKTTDGSEFRLISFDIWPGGDDIYTISAYKDNSLVGSEALNLDGASGFQTFTVATLHFDDIDEVRIINNKNLLGYIIINLDNIDVDTAIPPNSAPVLSNLNGDSFTYTEGDGAQLLDQGTALTLVDGDGGDFDSGNLTVTITSGEDASEDILSLDTSSTVSISGSTAGSNVSVSGTIIGTLGNNIAAGNDLVVNLNTNATAANIQNLARALTYQNSDTDNPTTGARNVRVTVNDGDGGTSSNSDITVTVAASNDAPSLSNLAGDSLSYSEGAAAQLIDQSTQAILTDVDSSNFNGGNLTVTITANEDAGEDILGFDNSVTTAGTAGATVTVSGTNIGTLSNNIAEGNDLVVNLNANATATLTQSLIRAVTYLNSDNVAPTVSTRTLRFTLNDGDGGTSSNIDTSVVVSQVNDLPSASNNTLNPNQGTALTLATSDFGYSDVEGDLLDHLTLVAAPANGTLWLDSDSSGTVNNAESALVSSATISKANLDAGLLKYLSNGATSSSFTFSVNDGAADSASNYTITLTVNAQPSVTINQASGQGDPTNNANVQFDVVFSESITGFDTSDISLSGDVTASVISVSASTGTSFTVTTNISANEGSIIAQVNAGGVTDGAGALNLASSSTDNSVEYDISAPAAPSGLDLVAGSDSGSSDSDDLTSDTTPEISGSGETNATLTLFSDANDDGILDGGEVTVTTSVSASAWAVSMPTLTNNNHKIKAFQTDPAGNASAVSSVLLIEVDAQAPSGHSVVINQNPVNTGNESALSFSLSAAEVGTQYSYSISSSGGGAPVTGSGTIATATDAVTGIDVSGLSDGTLTLNLVLTDDAGNSASPVTDTSTKDSIAPTGHSVSIDQAQILASNDHALSFTFAAAEVGSSYSYTINSSGGGSVNATGIVASATESISNIDVTSLSDGTLTLSVVLTDVNGNAATAVTDTVNKDALGPVIQSVSLNTGNLKAGDTITVSSQFDDVVILNGINSTATLNIGGQNRTAVYASGNNSSLLTFTYHVVSGDNDSNGVALTSIQSNGDTAKDGNGNDADFSFSTLTESSLLVDTIAPDALSPAQGAQSLNADDIDVSQSGYSEDGITIIALADSDGNGVADNNTALATTTSASGAWTLSLSLSQNSDNYFVLRASDVAGNSTDTPIGNFIEDSVSPSDPVVLSPVSPIYQSSTGVSITGSHSEDGISIGLYQDADNNGVADSNTPVSTRTVSSNSWSIALTLSDNSASNYLLIASDDAGNRSQAVNLVTLTHDDIDPSVDITHVHTQDTTPSLTGSVSDAGGVVSLSYTLEDSDNSIFGPFNADSFSDINSGSWVDDELASALADGIYKVHLSPVDLAGNTQVITVDEAVIIDTVAPSGYMVEIEQTRIDASNESALSFVITGGNNGDSFSYQVTDGSTSVTGSGSISTSPQAVANVDVSNLVEGSLSLTLSLTDVAGNTGVNVSDSVIKSYSEVNNSAPVLTGTPSNSIKVEELYSFTPMLFDADEGDSHSFSISGKPSWATFDISTGTLSGTPSNDDVGVSSNIVISVTDSSNASASLSAFSIEVTVLELDFELQTTAFQGEEDTELELNLVAVGSEGGAMTISLVNEPSHGALDTSGVIWLYQPEANFNGEDIFSVRLSNGQASSDPIEISINIAAVNDAPVAQDDSYEFAYAANGEYHLSVLANDEDIDGDTLSLVSGESSLGQVSIDGDTLVLTLVSGVSGNVSLSYLVADPDGENSQGQVSLSISPSEGDLPILTAPEAVTVQAKSLFTRVDLGVATAVDGEGEPLPVSLLYGQPLFRPGRHIVNWETTDSRGNTKVESQQVDVHPIVNFHKDQFVVEGSVATVTVVLNGEPPSYPVIIDFSVSGTAELDADYRLSSQQLMIESGLEVSFEVEILDDGTDENDEFIELLLSDSVNTGYKKHHKIHIVNRNIAPEIALTVKQAGEERKLVSTDSGLITISASYSDINLSDTLSVSLEMANTEVTDLDPAADVFSFDPSDMEPGIYVVRAEVFDGQLKAKEKVSLRLMDSLPTLGETDSDGDMLPDHIEGFADDDNDGIANYMDAHPNCNIQPENEVQQSQYLSEGEAGVCIRVGDMAIGGEQNTLLLDGADVLPEDEEFKFSSGVFDFVATGLPTQGAQYRIVLPQTQAVPANAVYRKYSVTKGWYEFVQDDENQLHSAIGEAGYCPSPGDASWQEGLIEGSWCIQLSLTDGGPNDDDGEANFSISDPGGVAILNSGNLAPIAMDDSAQLLAGDVLVLDPSGNDSDPEGDALQLQHVQGRLGVASINSAGLLEYQAPSDYLGEDEVLYTIEDGQGNSATARVQVTVQVNKAPVVQNDVATTNDRTPITVDVLANDSDEQTLSLVFVSAEQGSASITAQGLLMYTPKLGFDGEDKVTYRVQDPQGQETEAELVVTITAYQSIEINNQSSGGALGGLTSLAMLLLLLVRRVQVTRSIIVSSILFCGAAQAQWQMYAQTGLSWVSSDIDSAYLENQGMVVDEFYNDHDSFSWGLGLGYELSPKWKINVGYQDLGEFEVNATGQALPSAAIHSVAATIGGHSAQGVNVGGSYLWQLSQPIALKLGGGVWFWRSDFVSRFTQERLKSVQVNRNENGTDLYGELALHWKITEQVQFELGWQRFRLDSDHINNGFGRINLAF